MTVSVIMAAYNNEREVGLAVASVLLQDYKDFELVIVNDASTDAAPEILKRFAAQDARIVLLHNERNLGRAWSRNRAIETARGDLLAILDADDIAAGRVDLDRLFGIELAGAVSAGHQIAIAVFHQPGVGIELLLPAVKTVIG